MNIKIDDEMPSVYCKNAEVSESAKLTSSFTVYSLMKQYYGDDVISHHEEFWVLYLNVKNKVLKISKLAQGGISENFVDIRLIFQQALQANAVSVILVHNHPSNESYPSKNDMVMTKKIVEAGNLLDIKILDHLIVCDSNYYSFLDYGKL